MNLPALSLARAAAGLRHTPADVFLTSGLCVLLLGLLAPTTWAGTVDGSLRIEVITAYNLVVDSNIETPAGNCPTAAHIGVRIYNDGTTPMTDVYARVGELTNPATWTGTPGVYPTTTAAGKPYTGTFSFTHQGGSDDATRFIPEIGPGEYVPVYWFVSYRVLGDNGVSVAGACSDPGDDLRLDYDIWVEGKEGGTTPRQAYDERHMYCRCEISASANKIWPNTTSHVPDEYLDAVNLVLGWRAEAPAPRVPNAVVVEGIWYDFGTVRQGFDNDGDLIPDYNAWAQPVGNPATYDASAYRLVMTYGVLIVKLNDGTEKLILFENELYFMNLPENNTGVVGLVYYEFAALKRGVPTSTSPYQEVASGHDNEKFNADFGRAIGVPGAEVPDVTFDKTGPTSVSLNGTISYSLYTQNNETGLSLGDPPTGNYLVWSDSIPAGTVYVAGSASGSNAVPAGTALMVYYSTDHGSTWTPTEPAAASVTDLEWWLDSALAPLGEVTIHFQVTVPGTYTPAYVENCASFESSGGATVASDCTTTLINGSRTISGTVFADVSSGATYADGVLNGSPTESGIASVAVSLYVDINDDGILDSTDPLWGSVDSATGTGAYSFTNLPSARFIVVVDQTDSTILASPYVGYALTSNPSLPVNVTAGNSSGNNFGFAPALQLTKTLNGSSPVYEGDLVTYTITARNTRPGEGSGNPAHYVYSSDDTTATTETGQKAWTNPTYAQGAANGTYAVAPYLAAGETLYATGWNVSNPVGTIQQVEILLPIEIFPETGYTGFADSSTLEVNVVTWDGKKWNSVFTTPDASGISYACTGLQTQFGGLTGTLAVDVTSRRTWSWSDFASGSTYNVRLVGNKGSQPHATLGVDSVTFRVTSTSTYGTATDSNTLNPVPLTDTYDADLMQFVSASPAQTRVTTGGTQPDDGTITWSNIGPIYPGGTKTLTVTFRALDPANTVQTGVTNTALINQATYVNGVDSGDATSAVDVTINPTGIIGDFVWSDLNNNRAWNSGEPGIPNVTVFFDDNNDTTLNWTDGNGNGVWDSGEGERWTKTNASGYYSFTALRTNGPYNVRVLTTTLPGGSGTNTYDEDGNYNSMVAVTLVSLADHLTADFGYFTTYSIIRGTVWNDLDRAGEAVPEAGEPLLSGVTVGLYQVGNPTPVATRTTDANGYYEFVGSYATGNYYVQVTPTTGDMSGGTWTASYDTDKTTNGLNHQVLFNLVQGSVNQADFSYYETGNWTIGDTVFYDWDKDGTQDVGEQGIASVTVHLYNTAGFLLATTTTNASGTYTFPGRANGNYVVVVDGSGIPAGFAQTKDPDQSGVCTVCDAQASVTVSGADRLDIDFGYGPTGNSRIGDTVYYDANGNGAQDPGEAGIPNVTLKLYLDSNGDGVGDSLLATTTTADGSGGSLAGYYAFNNVAPPLSGQYYIVEVVPPTQGSTTLALTADPDRDGVPCSAGGLPACDDKDTGITFDGGDYLAADFGFQPLGVIGDYVWRDQNGDGVQDAGETGFAGVAVRVTNGTTTYTTTTDADGYYGFYGLADGSWTVSLPTPPSGYVATFDRDGTPNNSTVVVLSGGAVVLDADFGLRTNGAYSLAGTICINDARTLGLCDDVDNFLDDGVDLDAGPDDETELQGIVFYLYDASNALIATTSSDAQGNWSFGNLPNGTYRIVNRTTDSPLDHATLNTTANQTPADTISTSSGTSVVQTVTIAGASLTDLDLAFSSTVNRDYGDLPDSYLITRLNNDGARQIIPSGGATVYLGAVKPDADRNGLPTPYASGDDSFGVDDEDGVTPLNISLWSDGTVATGHGGSVQVTVPNGVTGYLLGWIDFNHDDTLLDAGELIISRSITGTGAAQTITFDIPAGTIGTSDESWLARFRILTSAPALPVFAYSGEVTNGEVEDYWFQRTVGSAIGDIVWKDSDNDGVQDAGEPGLAGVTVTLKGSNGATLATQTTGNGTTDVDGDGVIDPVGYYRFPGLSAATYSVSISLPAGYSFGFDENGGIDGTTTVTLPATTQHLTADFGLVPLFAAISGTVYDDGPANSNTIDGDDTPLSAVTVQLWTDPNGDGDPSDGTQIAEDYTNTVGAYLFTGVPTGQYVVVEIDPTGFHSDFDVYGANDNRIAVTLAGANSTGNNFLDDGGLLLSISGTVYKGDGLFGDLEGTPADDTPVEGITIELYIDADGDGTVGATDPFVTTAITAADGLYTFAHLPPGNYVVKEIDLQGTTSLDDTQGANTDNLIGVTLTTTDSTGNDFLDDLGTPTHALLGYVAVRWSGDRALLEWDTASEIGTVAFSVYRAEVGSVATATVAQAFPALGVPQGGRYRIADPGALADHTYRYLIEETDIRGATHAAGPFELHVPRAEGAAAVWGRPVRPDESEDLAPGLLPWSEAHPVTVPATTDDVAATGNKGIAAGLSTKPAARAARPLSPARAWAAVRSRMKIPVTVAGPYFVSATAIAAALDTSTDAVTFALQRRNLTLSCQGESVGYVVSAAGTGLYFYAEAYRSPYTATNVYWLEPGTVPATRSVNRRGPGRSAGTSANFPQVVHVEQDAQAIPEAVARPEDGLWVWGAMFAGIPGFDLRRATVTLTDLDTNGGLGAVQVRLHGGSDAETPTDHRVTVSVNTVPVGVTEWDGLTLNEVTFPVPAGILREGANEVLLQASLPVSSPQSYTYLDWVEMTYPRRYVARGDWLTFTAPPHTTVTVSGFTGGDIQLLDLTDPGRVGVLAGQRVTAESGGGYSVTFAVPLGSERFVAFLPAAARAATATGVAPSVLTAPGMGARHVIIAPPAFVATAQALADYRTAAGLPSVVVDLVDVFDTFAEGLPEPEAIRTFLRYAATAWAPPARYAVLAGEGTYDYMNVLRRNDNLIPPLLVRTPFGLFASDVSLGDVEGDGLAYEVAVGRLPAMTAAELSTMINKVIGYETAGAVTWPLDVLLAADAADDGGNFPVDSEALAADLLVGRTLGRVYIDDTPLATARSELVAGIQAGTRFLNWIGHGGLDRLSQAGLLTSADVPALGNAAHLPVVVAATCVIGRFEIPGTDCLGEKLMLKSGGGAIAVWAPSALAYNELSTRLSRSFYDAVYMQAATRVGDAVLQAMNSYVVPDPDPYNGLDAREVYNILGDPATAMQTGF